VLLNEKAAALNKNKNGAEPLQRHSYLHVLYAGNIQATTAAEHTGYQQHQADNFHSTHGVISIG